MSANCVSPGTAASRFLISVGHLPVGGTCAFYWAAQNSYVLATVHAGCPATRNVPHAACLQDAHVAVFRQQVYAFELENTFCGLSTM